MLKKIRKILSIIIITLISVTVLKAEESNLSGTNPHFDKDLTMEEAIKQSDEEFSEKHGVEGYFSNLNETEGFNEEVYNKTGFLVLGEPYGTNTPDGEPRHLGYTYDEKGNKIPVSNHFREPDSRSDSIYDNFAYIEKPWIKNEVTSVDEYALELKSFENNFSDGKDLRGTDEYLKSFIQGFAMYQGGDNFIGPLDPKYDQYKSLDEKIEAYLAEPSRPKWEDYYTIIVAPTETSMGLAKLWHKSSNGHLYYVTVPLMELGKEIDEDIEIKDPEETIGEIELDYNILSRRVKYNLPTNTAELTLPEGEWNGKTEGGLYLNNKTPNILRDFEIRENPSVDGAYERLRRTPEINTTIYRSDCEEAEQPIIGRITYNGIIRRPYTYTENEETQEAYAYASFSSGTDEKTIAVKTYNGMPIVPEKTYKNTITSNTKTSTKKQLQWTSAPIDLNVIRWMAHQDEEGKLNNWTDIPGLYPRTFTNQNSGTINWDTKSTMEEDYKQSREAARKGSQNTKEYDKAVFATDIDCKNIDYPIKSGYYFNPTGEYTFTIETTTYNSEIGPAGTSTPEHKSLVEQTKNSFKYESEFIYVNSYNQAVNIKGERVSNYNKNSVALTVQEPNGIDGLKMIETNTDNYTKTAEELQHRETNEGYTDPLIKEILEGYSNSETEESYEDYKYREYIENGQNIYRIKESTTITIQVNPNNEKLYTHVNMPNGHYTVKASIGEINLSESTQPFNTLEILQGIDSLDEITVTVNGSIYDDAY